MSATSCGDRRGYCGERHPAAATDAVAAVSDTQTDEVAAVIDEAAATQLRRPTGLLGDHHSVATTDGATAVSAVP